MPRRADFIPPKRFTDEEIREGVDNLPIHVPAHILEAARLGGCKAENVFAIENDE